MSAGSRWPAIRFVRAAREVGIMQRVLVAASVLLIAGCGGSGADSEEYAFTEPQVCVPGQPDPRACTPDETWKTTVCHIPPGNPANKHTICVGTPAVPAHLAHGDFLGSCCAGVTDDGGTPPPTDDAGPPPPPTDDMGAPPPPPPADLGPVP
jgi:hypothetical protein